MNRSAVFAAELGQLEPALAWARAAAPTWVADEVIDLGLVELVSNAIVHGSDSNEGRTVPFYGAQFVMSVHESAAGCTFTVSWERRPCPVDAQVVRDVDPWSTTGRGLLIATSLFDRLIWRKDGLSICAEIGRRSAA